MSCCDCGSDFDCGEQVRMEFAVFFKPVDLCLPCAEQLFRSPRLISWKEFLELNNDADLHGLRH